MDWQIAVLQQLRVCTLTIALAGCWGCWSKQSHTSSRSALIGTWRLQIGSSCSSKGVIRDELVLHSDGRLEQHATYGSGKQYDAVDQHWDIVTEKSVSLSNWLDLTDNPTGKPTFAVLSVELTHPAIILVNADSNCFYIKK
jgi:hypothetical protein